MTCPPWLLAALGPVVFTGAWFALGETTPGYDQSRDTISAVAAYDAPQAAAMVAAFAVQGVAQTTLGALLVRRLAAPWPGWLLLVSGLATVGAGFVRLPGPGGTGPDWTGTGHTLLATVAFAGLHLAALAAVLRPAGLPRWVPGLALLVALPHLAWFLAVLGTDSGVVGYTEKAFTTVLLVWTFALAVAGARRVCRGSAAEGARTS